MSVESNVTAQMREDWNRRAREDAHYYVAFGRREQNGDEFFATAKEVITDLDREATRLGAGNVRARRALEIGCGPGRLMKFMAQGFGEIHGVDVSDEMVGMAREKLRDIPHAHVHVTDGASLAMFADDSFDMVYSYAVFQHIPSKEVVLEYLREMHRVLKSGGVFRAQFNGLPESAPRYDTWAGVRFRPDELIEFATSHNFQLLALERVDTQYMWTSWRKRDPAWRSHLTSLANTSIHRVTNSGSSEPVAAASGRYASIAIWVRNLPEAVDLLDFEVLVDGSPAHVTYIGPPDRTGIHQINAYLPPALRTGLLPLEMRWRGQTLAPAVTLRIIPAGPQVPRVVSVSDGVNLLAGTRVESGVVKVTIEEIESPSIFRASFGDIAAEKVEPFCTDPHAARYEFNVYVPEAVANGRVPFRISIGRRPIAPVELEIVRQAG